MRSGCYWALPFGLLLLVSGTSGGAAFADGGSFGMAVQSSMGVSLDLRPIALRAEANGNYTVVSTTPAFTSLRIDNTGDLAYVWPDGRLAVLSTRTMESLRDKHILEEELVAVASVAAEVTNVQAAIVPYLLRAVRFDRAVWYTQRPGEYHRMVFPGDTTIAVSVPEWRQRQAGVGGQSLNDNQNMGVVWVKLRDQEVFRDYPGPSYVGVSEELYFGTHPLTCNGSDTPAGFAARKEVDYYRYCLEALTDPTEDNFAVTGPGAQRVRLASSQAVATLTSDLDPPRTMTELLVDALTAELAKQGTDASDSLSHSAALAHYLNALNLARGRQDREAAAEMGKAEQLWPRTKGGPWPKPLAP